MSMAFCLAEHVCADGDGNLRGPTKIQMINI